MRSLFKSLEVNLPNHAWRKEASGLPDNSLPLILFIPPMFMKHQTFYVIFAWIGICWSTSVISCSYCWCGRAKFAALILQMLGLFWCHCRSWRYFCLFLFFTPTNWIAKNTFCGYDSVKSRKVKGSKDITDFLCKNATSAERKIF